MLMILSGDEQRSCMLCVVVVWLHAASLAALLRGAACSVPVLGLRIMLRAAHAGRAWLLCMCAGYSNGGWDGAPCTHLANALHTMVVGDTRPSFDEMIPTAYGCCEAERV